MTARGGEDPAAGCCFFLPAPAFDDF